MISLKQLYRKTNISRFFQSKCIKNQIWPCCKKDKGQPRFIICANLVGPTSPMLYTKSQGHWSLGPRVEIFKGLLPYMGIAAIYICDHLHLVQIYSTQRKESPYEIGVQLAKWFLRKLCFNILMGLQYE